MNMRLVKTYLGYFPLLALAFALLGCGSADERKAVHMERGQAFFAEEVYEKAQLEFKNVLQMDDKDLDARFWLGKTLEELESWEKAVGYYLAVAQQDPSNMEVRVRLGQIFLAAGALDNALTQAEELLRIEPQHPEALLLRGMIFARQDKLDDALKDAQAVLKQSPEDVNGVVLLSSIYMRKDQSEMALDLVVEAIERNPDDIGLLIVKAGIHSAREEMPDAARDLQEVVVRDPETLAYRLQLATFYARYEQLDKAEQTLRAAVAYNTEDVAAKLVLVSFLAKHQTLRQAEQLLLESIRPEQGDQRLRFALAKLYEASNRSEKVRETYDEIIRLEEILPNGLVARTRLAEYLLKVQQLDEAAKLVQQVLQEDPRDSAALIVRAQVELANGNLTDSISDSRAVLRDNPDSSHVLRLLARAQIANNQGALGMANLEKALKIDPKDLSTRADLVKTLIDGGDNERADSLISEDRETIEGLYYLYSTQHDWKVALQISKQLEKYFPNDPAGYYFSGVALQGSQDYQESLRQFNIAIEKAPNASEPLTKMVQSYIALEDLDGALKRLLTVLDTQPNNHIARNLVGQILSRQGKLDEAEETFMELIKIKPDWSIPHAQLASVRTAKDDIPGAIHAYESGLESLPNDEMLVSGLALQYEQMGEYERAISLYQEALNHSPDSMVVLNNLAMLLAEHSTDKFALEKAASLAQRLESAQNPAFQDTLGWVQYRQGNYQTAVTTLERVVRNSEPTAPIFDYHLGMAYLKHGDTVRARSHLERALSEEKDFGSNDEARAALDSL